MWSYNKEREKEILKKFGISNETETWGFGKTEKKASSKTLTKCKFLVYTIGAI